jgi:general secretion pathway protein K
MIRFTDQKGIALIMVLWVLAILMTVALSFSYTTKTGILSTASYKDNIEKSLYAEAGIQRAIAEIFYRRQNLNIEGSGAWRIDGRQYEGEIGDGGYKVSIFNEMGKIDINSAPETVLRNLFLNSGISESDADTIVDSIIDWKDSDDLHRLHGAESDYYQSLPSPYKAKNAPFDTVEELLLVKGVTKELLYGNGGKKGIIEFMTVNSKQQAININSAPKEVIMAVPGMTENIADSIINMRQEKEIINIGEVQTLAGENFMQMSRYINSIEIPIYTMHSEGFKKGSKGSYGITATVVIEGNNKYRYVYYKKPAEMR